MRNLIGSATAADTVGIVQIRQKRSDHVTVLELEGRLDATTTGDLQTAVAKVRDRGCVRLLLNLKELTYISSAGLGILVSSAKTLQHHGGDLFLCELRDNVRKVFEISGFTRIFHLYDSEQEALGDLSDL